MARRAGRVNKKPPAPGGAGGTKSVDYGLLPLSGVAGAAGAFGLAGGAGGGVPSVAPPSDDGAGAGAWSCTTFVITLVLVTTIGFGLAPPVVTMISLFLTLATPGVLLAVVSASAFCY